MYPRGWLLLSGLMLMAIRLSAAATGHSLTQCDDYALSKPFTLLPYESNYFLVSQAQSVNRAVFQGIGMQHYTTHLKQQEAKFQVSIAFLMGNGILGESSWLGFSYTQCAWWQLFSPQISSPFREINYEPQLFIAWRWQQLLPLGWHLQRVELGFNHHSNGRSRQVSRSWNRLYARFLVQHGQWQLDLKPWLRFQEGQGDDNPEITHYLGHYRLQIAYDFKQGSRIYLKHHSHWPSGYGGCELGGDYPLTRTLRLYLQWFTGYGESLIDYNFRQSRFGIGVIIVGSPPAGEQPVRRDRDNKFTHLTRGRCGDSPCKKPVKPGSDYQFTDPPPGVRLSAISGRPIRSH